MTIASTAAMAAEFGLLLDTREPLTVPLLDQVCDGLARIGTDDHTEDDYVPQRHLRSIPAQVCDRAPSRR